jgi:3-hydroxyacyl-[acyl-carrier-protein] dehydratase
MTQSDAQLEADIRQRVKATLRRELKLGDDAQIPDDMPLIGGGFELDSLDVVLLISAVEKEFGVSIRSENVGRDAFANVEALVNFIQQRADGSATPAETTPAENGQATAAETPTSAAESVDDPEALLAQLPHQPPFRFLSQLTGLMKGQSAAGLWNVTGSEDFFAGHFPGRPILPGVLISEALAQLSGMINATGQENTPAELAHVDVRFKQAVAPPATLQLQSRFIRQQDGLEQFEVAALHEQTRVADGRIALKRHAGQ